MPNKISIKPDVMTLDQAVAFCHMLNSDGRQKFLTSLTTEESKLIESSLFEINDRVIIKRCDGRECNGTVVAIGKFGTYRVAYIIYNQVTVGNLHHSRIRLGQLDTQKVRE